MLDVFRKSKDEDKRQREQAQKMLAKQVEKQEKKDDAKGWKQKLYAFATLGGKIKPDTTVVVKGKVKNPHLYMPSHGGRLNPTPNTESLGRLVRNVKMSSETKLVYDKLSQGADVNLLAVETGLPQNKINEAINWLSRNKYITVG